MAELRVYPNDLLRRRILVALKAAPDGLPAAGIAEAAGIGDADEAQRDAMLRDLVARRLVLVDGADLSTVVRYYHPKTR